MPIREPIGGQSETRGVPHATGFGAAAGNQAARTRRLRISWKNGLVLGLALGVPTALRGYAPGLRWSSYGLAIVVTGLVVGTLMALRALAADRCRPRSTERENARDGQPPRARGGIGHRLADEKDQLERLDAERARRRSAMFGKAAEDRIIWGELLDLELQDIDEQLRRIRGSMGAGGIEHTTAQRRSS